jgi:hypothetical protein
LIGKRLGQFHSDYPEISNDNEDIAFQCRLKGILQDGIAITANKLYPRLIPVELRNGRYYPMYEEFKNKCSVEQLYEDMFAGNSREFDLCESASPCFDLHSNFSIETKSSFVRKIRC